MPPARSADPLTRLPALRRKHILWLCLDELARIGPWLAAAAALALAVLLVLLPVLTLCWPVPATFAAAVVLLAPPALLAITRRWPRDRADTARWLDRRLPTHDRWRTLLAFSQTPGAGPGPDSLRQAALLECREFLLASDSSPAFRPDNPVRARLAPLWPILAALAAAFFAHAFHAQRTSPPHLATLPPLAAAVADQLRNLAQTTRQRPDPESQKAADALEDAARRLEAERPQTPEDATRAALRELSSAEAALKAQRDSQASASRPLSPEDKSALAEALQQTPATAQAGHELAQGNTAEAGRQLAEALANPDPAKRAALEAQLARALQSSIAKRPDANPSPTLQNAAQASAAAELQKALQELSELLQREGITPGSQPAQQNSGPPPPPADPESLRQLAAALQNLKDAIRRGDVKALPAPAPSGGKPGEPGDQPASLADAPPGSTPDAIALIPGLAQNNTLDTGHNDPFTGDKSTPAKPAPGQATSLRGVLGEGASLQTLVKTAGDNSEAKRIYKEIYQNAAPSAEDAVLREDLPLGSRQLIKNYFQAIRPEN